MRCPAPLIALLVVALGGSVVAAQEAPNQLPIRKVPNVPENGEAYYAPDNLHLIAQVKDAAANAPGKGEVGGALTYTFTDTGDDIRRINDHGQDACSFFFPDMRHIVWTSTRDNMDMPPGNWSDDRDYPQGAELYVSDLDGKNVRRLTHNRWYDAEVTVSPDGRWLVFGRQVNGNADLWRIKPDGTGEQQLTFTDDWQEGEGYFLPDSETVIFRAWKHSEKTRLEAQDRQTGGHSQTPIILFTMKIDGSDVQPRTFTTDMNWSPYPAPDGRHFAYVRIVEGKNWEMFLGDLAGGEPVRLTFNPGFDGMGAFSPDGKKMVFTRGEGKQFMSGLYSYVMDVSSLNLGPDHYKGVPPKATPPAGWQPDPDFAAFKRKAVPALTVPGSKP